MATYPCSNCGERADAVKGCPACGRTVAEEIAALSQVITQMQFRNKDIVEKRTLLLKRIQGAIATRSLLQKAAGQQPKRGTPVPTDRRGRTGTNQQVPGQRVADASRYKKGGPPPKIAPAGPGAGTPSGPTRPPAGAPGTTTTGSRAASALVDRLPRPRGPQVEPGHQPHAPETSTQSTQNILLGLGALLFAVTAVLLAPNFGPAGRITVFLVLTVVLLGGPLLIARRGLTATAETIATVGLVFVLIDGFNFWSAGWLRGTGLAPAGYAGLVCLCAAGVATAYRLRSHLVAPRFAAVLLVQPVMPLLGYPLIHHEPAIRAQSAWALVFAAVAAANLALAMVLNGSRARRGSGLWARALAGPNSPRLTRHTPYLLDAVWVLHAIGVLLGVLGAIAALASTRQPAGTLAGAAALVIAGVVGMGGGLLLRRRPLPDIGVALGMLAGITAFGRLSSVVAPGSGLIATALAVLTAALALRLLNPVVARRGARWASALAAGGLGLLIVLRGHAVLTAPIQGATPFWHADLTRWPAMLTAAAGSAGWQFSVAALVLGAGVAILRTPGDRIDAAVLGVGLAALLTPAGWGLPWAVTPVLLVGVALAIGASALASSSARSAWIRSGTAGVVGIAAAAVAMARPSAAALALAALAVGGAVIGAAPRIVVGPSQAPAARGVASDLALGGAAFALPGAIASGTAALGPGHIGAAPILAATFLAVAGTLCAVAMTQVAWDRDDLEPSRALPAPSPVVATGATLGAVILAVVAIRVHATFVDTGVAVLLLLAGLSLLVAPVLDGGWRGYRARVRDTPRTAGLAKLTGTDVAAVAVTTATIAAVARVAIQIVPHYALASAAVVVLLVATAIRGLPPSWRRGPIVGGAVVSAVVAAVAGTGAVAAAVAAISEVQPVWNTNLTAWTPHVTWTWVAQAPFALLALAAAAAIALPRAWSAAAVAVTVALAALAAPAALGLPWWSPILLSGATATAAGLASALNTNPRAAWVLYGIAALLFADTVGASLVAAQTTATTLAGAAAINGAVALTAARTRRRIDLDEAPPAHLALIGGGALAAGMLAISGCFGCFAASVHTNGAAAILTAALAGLCLALAVAAVACYNDDTLLPSATVAVAIGGTVIAVGTLQAHLHPVVYAAAVSLLVVLAELLRVAVVNRRANLPGAGLRARNRELAPQTPPRPGYGLFLACGPATAIALVWLAGPIAGALLGPYEQLQSVWRNVPRSALDLLGGFDRWPADRDSLAAAFLLTIAAALGAIGFGGSNRVIAARAVAVVIPGVAVTALIAPAALELPWPTAPAAALLVAALCGLGVALTPTPPATVNGSPLRIGRRIITVICVLAGAAGLAGSLAGQDVTIFGLTVVAAAGLAAALYGTTRPARLIGWLVTALAGHLLALVIGLVAGLAVYQSAFLVVTVAAAMLVLASLLPRLRSQDALSESTTVEAAAYAGALLALLLASRSLPYLAAFCTVWGAVLGVAAARPGRVVLYRRALIWLAAAHEVVAWWLLMHLTGVALPEAYTAAVAVVAVITGYVETRRHPEISSWAAYGVALVAAFLPTVVIVVGTDNPNHIRRAVLILAAATTVVLGSVRQQRAPIVVGAVTLIIATLHELAVLSTAALLWAVMGLVALVLVGLGASTEQRRRRSEQLRGAWGKLR